MRHQRYLLFSICLVAAVGCSEEFTPTPYTYSKIFTGENNKTWKVTLIEETLNGNIIDKFLPSCLTDDRYVFYANPERSLEAISGSRKCFEDEADITTDTWSFSNATATLTMILPIFSDSSIPFKVREAEDDDMEVEIFFDETNTGSYRIHFEAIDEE
ncbi:MAG TPA: hypothetical protein VK589_23230 [Chryseolinea sp.]|nr:hypothetical protein [Chryseolinea sp.]